MEYIVENRNGAERPPWAMATVVYLQSHMSFASSEAWWGGGERWACNV